MKKCGVYIYLKRKYIGYADLSQQGCLVQFGFVRLSVHEFGFPLETGPVDVGPSFPSWTA